MLATEPSQICRVNMKKIATKICRDFVSERRFELPQPFGHYPLKVACLPISPPGH